jgi:hypothetical protein
MPYYSERHRVPARNKRQEKKQILAEHFGNKCMDCEQTFPVCCYDYHHRNPEEKSFEIAGRMYLSMEELIEEGDKCDLLCSNCHRIRHFKSWNDK